MQKTDSRIIETCTGHPIRFVLDDGEWWASVNDVLEALGAVSIKSASANGDFSFLNLNDGSNDEEDIRL
jgi:prophage antirepressor-like protein